MAKMSQSDIRQMVTDAIVKALESGTNPWRKPWTPDSSAIPHNCISGHMYRGVNVAYLWAVQMNSAYPTAQWLTFNQARKAGGKVKKGEKATHIVFTKPVTVKDKTDPDESNTFFLLRTYAVFNLDQTEGVKLPKRELPDPHPPSANFDQQHVDNMFALYDQHKVSWKYNGGAAFFNPAKDEIELPKLETFHDVEGFAATGYHELVHWTGHKSRLNRIHTGSFNKPEYAYEELVAEIGSAMLCQHQQVNSDLPQHASYIESWLKALKNDNKLIFKASRTAEKALVYLMPELDVVE